MASPFSGSSGRKAAVANTISGKISAGVKIVAANSWVTDSMPQRPSTRRCADRRMKRQCEHRRQDPPAIPSRTHSLWSTKNCAISSAVDVGDSGGKSLAIPEKHAL